MAIFNKSSVSKDIEEFRSRSKKLLDVISGKEPNPNIYDKYTENPDQYRSDYLEIDMEELEYAISDFETSLKVLKKLKIKKAKPLHSAR